MTANEFVAKWRTVTASEHAVAQTHFNELCDLLDVPKPLEADPTGESYAFERSVRKAARGKGFADVWKRNAFAWEYKTRGRDLGDAYRQLLLYRDDLGNPPLLVVCNIDRIEVHTNFTGTTKAVHVFLLDDLRDAAKLADLRSVWTHPSSFNPQERRERITEEATKEIGRIALSLRERGHEPQRVAHFLMQVVFALFAEDVRLLPNRIVSRILERDEAPERVTRYLTDLFDAMGVGGDFALEEIAHFNGGLFDGKPALPLNQEEIRHLHAAAQLDWSDVEPAIFGTLFERSLDPAKRSQLGAHYTSRADILRIVEPVVMQPLQRRWAEIREAAEEFLTNTPKSPNVARRRRIAVVDAPLAEFLRELHGVRVLDPACGSGNFLYVALQMLKDLEHEVVTFGEQVGAAGFRLVGPRQFLGIEINPFARELASMVVWIGYLQWNRANGVSNMQRPILEPLDNIRLHDALMNDDETEYEWPEAEFIIGNPPFLGDRRMRRELGDAYVDALRSLFAGRIPGSSDLVCYWFEKARAAIENRRSRRAGLIATNSITGGSNSRVLERIRDVGGIFLAWRDEPWLLEGAAVRVSIVGFDDGSETTLTLDGRSVETITPQLTSFVDLSLAQRLRSNFGKAFVGVQKGGAFDVSAAVANEWLYLPNPSGAANADVLRPFVGGRDIVDHYENRWLIDFEQMAEDEARRFVVPFAHVEALVKPGRMQAHRAAHKRYWWRHHDTRPALRRAISDLSRYIATPHVSQHRVLVWQACDVLPSNLTIVVAADDDYTFGVLHSRLHEVWSLALGTRLESRPRYTPSTSFETFAFPEPSNEQREAIGELAVHLNAVRDHLRGFDSSLTMTKLYNEVAALREQRETDARAFPLLLAHDELDEAVALAYGWDWPLADDEILQRLLALNLERAGVTQ